MSDDLIEIPTARIAEPEGLEERHNLWPTYQNCPLRYGVPGTGGNANPDWESRCLVLIDLPYPMVTAWTEPDPHTRQMVQMPIKRTRVNREVASSLGRVLNAILNHVYQGDYQKLVKDGMHLYGGCYNYRPIRGGTSISMHAYGAAIDLNPDQNALGSKKYQMPESVIEVFKAENWIWGGEFKNRVDPMHFEASAGH